MVVYRKLITPELPSYCEHLLRLDPRDRRARFMMSTADDVIEEHCRSLDLPWTILIGAFQNGVIRGAVELVGSPSDGMDQVELAVSVERCFQNTGAGTELVRQAVLVAQNRNIRRIRMLCLQQNRRMQAICKKLHGLLDYDEVDVMCDLKVAAATRQTLWQEQFQQGLPTMGAVVARRPRAPQPHCAPQPPCAPKTHGAPQAPCVPQTPCAPAAVG